MSKRMIQLLIVPVFLSIVVSVSMYQTQPAHAACICVCSNGSTDSTSFSNGSQCDQYCTAFKQCPPPNGACNMDTAQSTCDTAGAGNGGTPSGPPAQYSLDTVDPLKFGPGRTVENLTIEAIKYVLGFVGVGVFAAFLYGGALMIFSAGNPKRVGAGKNVLVYSVIGLAIIFFSYTILSFFFNILSEGAG